MTISLSVIPNAVRNLKISRFARNDNAETLEMTMQRRSK